ncbi:MAG: hypothetical protein B7Z39_00105 [Novosphingobium sp. 12-64-8]|nr:MAG: hypothetical protein B7Z39_00105 [Novosphingobium sp. 12-64-8]
MYQLLFRSRWVALMWVAGMAAYAVFMTSGGSALMGVPSASSENSSRAKREAEEEKKAQFAEWAETDRSSSQSGAQDTNDDAYAAESAE